MGDLDRLRLLASAFAGRAVEVGAAGSGEPGWTDGTTIYVDPGAPANRQVRTLAVQGSLLAVGSFEADVVRSLGRRRSLADRYLAVEGHRALIANEAVLPPGLWPSIDQQVAAGLTTPAESLERARQDDVAIAPADFGSIRPRSLLLAAAPVDVHAAAPAPATGDRASADLEELDEADDEADGPLGDLASSPVGGGGGLGRLFQHLLRPVRHRDGGGPPGADAPTHRGSARPGAGRRAVVVDAAAEGLGGVVVAEPGPGASYPEWDVDRRRYRPDWCTVAEVEPPAPPSSASVGLPDGAALRRPLARLGIGLARCRRERQGDEIDLDAAVEARVDALAGVASADGVYVASLRRRRDLAVLVLLDVSGSAGEPGIAGRTVHQHQQAVAGALTVALHDLGDRVALYGFRSRGRQAVELLRVKAFDDHLDGSVARRLAGLTPGAYTRLGAAIRHGAAILDERGGTPRRLLLVVSDGFAYDHGYEASYGQADARRALLEARRAGIGCLCLSVGTDVDPDALRRVFGSAAHATVPRADDLPRHIGPLFRRALRSAEAQHRSFQRIERTRERHLIEGRTDGREPATVLRPGR